MRNPRKRKAPLWVRDLSKREAHQLAGHFQRRWLEGRDLSSAQEWLWDTVVADLRWRARNELGRFHCSCVFCCGLEPVLPTESGDEFPDPF